ncbi:glycoside hydrolase family 3 N-terminal domain-containing protein [Streptomyces sp. JV176]|uniref:glycoside hydrolase family 3 N-terminal domain-containing protein n=1 Tax=Streptomyces sp. JV176 TaxID=858630 RepID=UPI002E78F8DF|nr:glycoside hydrolase family 3 N-terminal domain-containing protein [Streptomyces sp. JV176]MEE1801083.1 glycoside hydrolase family 3 N-terminal domain-containing protein [Streptomyces sp. JV176]
MTGHDHESRIGELLNRMTVEEKFGQLQQLAWAWDTGPGGGDTEAAEAAARKGLLGSVLNVVGAGASNALQRIAVEESRLGIPLVFGLDVIHGYHTTFPVPLAQAAAFDPAVTAKDAEVSAREARSNGVHWTFSPMMDVTREPRWGRIAESTGEDPYLTTAYAMAKVRGYQGDDLTAPDRIAACAKHFVAYGGAEGGRDYNTVDVSEQRLRNLYLPPFRAAVGAGAATVMAGFNTISGIPAHAHPHTLTDILKEEWGFDGVVVSDWTGVLELIAHGAAAHEAEAARRSLTAGVDMEMVSTTFADHGRDLLASGALTRERLDDAVARVLRLKLRLGLFESPYVAESAALTAPSAESRAAAREVAGRCVVLLKNDDGLLPLDTSGPRALAVVGPFADSGDLLGTWTLPGAPEAVPVLAGLRAALPDTDIRHAAGVSPEGLDTSGIAEAVAVAEAADAVVLVVGEPPALSGEAAARSELGLPGAQEQLVRAVAGTGTPCVVVLVGGRPLTIGTWADRVPAIVMAWHPGIEAGHAVADVLTGAVVPGGKLPVTFPRTVGQVPLYHNHERTGRPYDPAAPGTKYVSRYLDLDAGPEFVFGHGLSYTTFALDEPRLSRERIGVTELRAGATVEVAVPVRNTGGREGDEVVQLYLQDPAATIAQPVRRLCGFRRVRLAPGEERQVRFTLGADDIGYWTDDPAGEFIVEPGELHLHTGNSSRTRARRTLLIT